MSGNRQSPERKLHLFTVQLLKMAARPGVVWFHPANESKRTPRMGAFLKLMGLVAGVSDIILALPPSGRMAALELKSERGRLTVEQRRFQDALERCGGLIAVAHTPEDVQAVLKEWGAVA